MNFEIQYYNLEPISNDEIAIQLVVNDSEFEVFLVFRNALLNDSNLLVKYNQLKTKCTGLLNIEYREIKSSFIEAALDEHKKTNS